MTISFVIVTFHKRSLLICFTMLRLHTVPSNNIGYDVIKYIICGIQSRSVVRYLNFSLDSSFGLSYNFDTYFFESRLLQTFAVFSDFLLLLFHSNRITGLYC